MQECMGKTHGTIHEHVGKYAKTHREITWNDWKISKKTPDNRKHGIGSENQWIFNGLNPTDREVNQQKR